MLWLVLGGLFWMVAAIALISDEDWQTLAALPGSLAFIVGLVGEAFVHISISLH